VGCVDGNTSAPPELKLSWQCERYSCLPENGGMLDQDHTTMLRMAVLSNIYNAYSHYRNAHGTQIHSLSESERRILRWMKDEGILFRA
jgi:hypothetical protein